MNRRSSARRPEVGHVATSFTLLQPLMRPSSSLLAAALAAGAAGCSSVSPAGPPPAGAQLEAGACAEVSGRFQALGQAFRGGRPIDNTFGEGAASVLDAHRGCNAPAQCLPPVFMHETPQAFEIKVSPQAGWSVRYTGTENKALGEQSLPASRVACTNGVISVTLHDGLRPASPGGWTIGRETLTVEYGLTSDGNLIARRTSKTADVFWFGLPVWSETGTWYVHRPER